MEIFRMFGSVFVNDTASASLEKVEKKADETDSKITSMGEKMSSFGESLAKVGEGLITYITLPIAAATAGVIKLADKASDLNEANNVIENTFKSSAKAIEAWTKTTADSAGISQTASSQWVGFMGAMLKSSGVTEQSAADMSKKLVQLTGDMSSFYNIGTSDMWEKIRSGISGETMPLKELGINMDVANLSAFAMSQGITKAYKDMSQSEQTMLRYNYLLSVTKDAQGDFGRTLESSFANQARVAKLNLENLATSFGSKFLPSVLDSTKGLNGYMVALNKALNGENQSAKLGDTINNIANAISKLKPEDIKNLASVGVALASIGPGILIFGKLTEATGKFQTGIEKSVEAVTKFGLGAIDGFGKAQKGIEGFLTGTGKASVLFRTLSNDARLAIFGISDIVGSKLSPLTGLITSKLSAVTGLYGKLPVGLQVALETSTGNINKFLTSSGGKIANGLGTMGTKVFSGLSSLVSLGMKMFLPAALIGMLIVGLGVAQQHFETQLNQMIQQVIVKGPEMIQKFTAGILTQIPTLMQSGTTLLINFINAIIATAPSIINSAVAILTSLVNGLTQQLPRLLPVVAQLILTIVTAIVNNLPQIINAGLNLLVALANGFGNNSGQMVTQIINLILRLATVIIQNLPAIISAAVQIVVALIRGISSAIPQLIAMMPQIISSIWNALTSVNWGQVGMQIIQGIISGIGAAAGGLFNSLKNVASGALNAAKSALGIHSPSKKFQDEIGQYIPAGIAAGIEDNGDIVNEKLKNLSDSMQFNTSVKTSIDAGVANDNDNKLMNPKGLNNYNGTNKISKSNSNLINENENANSDLVVVLNSILELIKIIANNPAKFNMNGKTLWEALSPYAAMSAIRRG